ncbi:MAG: hypothetical protein H6Q73_1858 [Firmicutes bacterium]|nr:hypothetical protein [Bacillota bacterium]
MREPTVRWMFSGSKLSIRNIIIAIIVFGVVLLAVVWGSVGYKLTSERQICIANTKSDEASFARAFEESTLRVIKSADAVAVILKYQYEKQGRMVDMAPYRTNGEFQIAPYRLCSIADENGDLVLSNQTPFVFSNISDREHFLVHKEVDTERSFISKPVLGRSSSNWSIQISRRINKPDGSFGGVVVVSLDPFYLTRFYEQVSLGKDSSIALIGKDGIGRGGQSGSNSLVGFDFSSSKVLQLAAENDAGFFTENSLVDGVTRIYHYRVLAEYPLMVVVGISENEALAGYYEQKKADIIFASIISLFILGFCGLIINRIMSHRQQEKLQQALYKINDTANTCKSIPEFSRSFQSTINELIAAPNFYIAIYDDITKTLQYINELDTFSDHPNLRNLSEQVIRSGKTLIYNQGRLEVWPVKDIKRPRACWLGVPLKTENKVFGVMAAAIYNERELYEKREIDIFVLMATQVAMVLGRRLVESELRKLSRVVEQSPIIVVILDAKGRVEYINPAFMKITGYTAEEVVGYMAEDLFNCNKDDIFNDIEAGLTKDNVWRGEICNRKKSGKLYWQKALVLPIRSMDGEIRNYVGIGEDITEQKRVLDLMSRNLELAGQIQKSYLPQDIVTSCFEVRTFFQPYHIVSGDIFDCRFSQAENVLSGYIIDVMGHGFATALQTAALKVLFTQAMELDLTVDQALKWINEQSTEYFEDDSFAAVIYFKVDFTNMVLNYASGGINHFFVRQQDGLRRVTVPGSLVGIAAGQDFEAHQLALKSGDSIHFLSDGILDLLAEQTAWR